MGSRILALHGVRHAAKAVKLRIPVKPHHDMDETRVGCDRRVGHEPVIS